MSLSSINQVPARVRIFKPIHFAISHLFRGDNVSNVCNFSVFHNFCQFTYSKKESKMYVAIFFYYLSGLLHRVHLPQMKSGKYNDNILNAYFTAGLKTAEF